jgi:hypothetical protein
MWYTYTGYSVVLVLLVLASTTSTSDTGSTTCGSTTCTAVVESGCDFRFHISSCINMGLLCVFLMFNILYTLVSPHSHDICLACDIQFITSQIWTPCTFCLPSFCVFQPLLVNGHVKKVKPIGFALVQRMHSGQIFVGFVLEGRIDTKICHSNTKLVLRYIAHVPIQSVEIPRQPKIISVHFKETIHFHIRHQFLHGGVRLVLPRRHRTGTGVLKERHKKKPELSKKKKRNRNMRRRNMRT